ncbi:MAG: DUF4367 domain-containing protein [Oscillospiraceae bacterium]|nr:DUF4367 domain-containing protein [Oscillospiraceae bacterium]
MAECEFDLILEEWAEGEWEALADAPEFEPSKKHERAMRRIFKRYERNARKLSPRFDVGIRTIRRKIAVVILVIILAVLSGCTTAYIISKSFQLDDRGFMTVITLLNTENCPTDIECEYYLPVLPEEFELIYRTEILRGSVPCIYKSYENKRTGQQVTFSQQVKPGFEPINHNTTDSKLTEVEINGHGGLFNSIYDSRSTWVMWDNGDYILEVWGNLNKYDMLYLAETAKIL